MNCENNQKQLTKTNVRKTNNLKEMIPDKSRPEWADLVTGRKQYALKNYVLQMRVSQAIKDINTGRYTVQEIVNQLYNLCSKYERAVAEDITAIFGQE